MQATSQNDFVATLENYKKVGGFLQFLKRGLYYKRHWSGTWNYIPTELIDSEYHTHVSDKSCDANFSSPVEDAYLGASHKRVYRG